MAVTLTTSLSTARMALQAQSAALQTAGHNVSNVNTAGFSRQRVNLQAAQPLEVAPAQVGTGVSAIDVQRVVDASVEAMVRSARTALSGLKAQSQSLGRIEALMGELQDGDLSDAMGRFFDSAEDFAANPADISVRRSFVSSGEGLAEAFRRVDGALRSFRTETDLEVRARVQDLNRLASGIADLNRQIVAAEGGGSRPGTANDLRDRREEALKELGEIVQVRAVETAAGEVNVLAGSDFLVFGRDSSAVEAVQEADAGSTISEVRFVQGRGALAVNGGALQGLTFGRDAVAKRVIGEVSAVASGLIGEVNRIHASGVGLLGQKDVTGTERVADAGASLASEEAGLAFPPTNGAFDLNVRNSVSGQVQTFRIDVDLDGTGASGEDTSLSSLAAAVNGAVTPTFGTDIAASVTNTNRLRIVSANPAIEFYVTNDSANVMAALGIGTFFAGKDSATMAVNTALASDPARVAAGTTMAPGDNVVAIGIAALRGQKTLAGKTATFEEFYRGTVSALGIEVQDASDRLDNQAALTTQIVNQRESISGVSLDDEAMNLIKYQRAFQGAARFVAVVDELLDTLVRM